MKKTFALVAAFAVVTVVGCDAKSSTGVTTAKPTTAASTASTTAATTAATTASTAK